MKKKESSSDLISPLLLIKNRKEEPTIKISVFTKKEPFCCSLFPLSHIFTHSSAIIEHIPTKRKYLVSHLGRGFVTDQEKLNDPAKITKFAKFKSATILAFEKNGRTFDNFAIDYKQRYVDEQKDGRCEISNCAQAVLFSIDYFPRQPSESCTTLLFRQGFKCGCGVFGTCLCIRACPTLPGITSSEEVEKYARAIEQDQKLFSENRLEPKSEMMTERSSLLYSHSE